MCIFLSSLGNGSVNCITPFIARQRLYTHVPVATNTRNRPIVRRVSLWVCLCTPLASLGNNSIKTFPRKRRIFGGVVFYVIHIVSKESKRLVLPRTSSYLRVVYLPMLSVTQILQRWMVRWQRVMTWVRCGMKPSLKNILVCRAVTQQRLRYVCLLRICYLETDVPLFVLRPLPRNECCFRAFR
jgi:hypothetical protein